jgi:hypothetical protein
MKFPANANLAFAAACMLGGVPAALAGPQTQQTNYVSSCFPPDVNVNTVGIGRGIRSIDELEFTAGSTTPVRRRTYELDREGRLLGWTLSPLKGGRQEWAKLMWERGRLVVFDSGSFDPSMKYQFSSRVRYDYEGSKLTKVNRLRSALTGVTAPVEPADWRPQDLALVHQQQMPNGEVWCLKVPVDESRIALLEIVGPDGFYRQQVSLPMQTATKSEALAARELARLIGEGVFKRDYPADNRLGWITVHDGNNKIKAFSSLEPVSNSDYTQFDGRGQISEAGVLRDNYEVNPQRRFEYRFDASGNWSQATELALKGLAEAREWVPVKTYKRSLRYYD